MTRIAITAGATAGNKRRAATHYGVRDIENKLPSEYMTHEGHVVQHIVYNFDDLPASGLDAEIKRIPANSRIVGATLRVLTPFAGGTSYIIGLEEPDGTVIDADGVFEVFLTAVVDTLGETVVAGGNLVANLDGIGTADAQIVVAATGTFTAGKAVLELEYAPLVDRAESQDV